MRTRRTAKRFGGDEERRRERALLQLAQQDPAIVTCSHCAHSRYVADDIHACRLLGEEKLGIETCRRWAPFVLYNPLFADVPVVSGEA
jgi:hypothetical protein